MSLHVYEWFSYACNNSSDHRLIAEFESEEKAAEMAKELAAVFLANAEQADAAVQEGGDWDPYDLDPSPALVAFAEKYGGEFEEGLIWGDDSFVDDLPEVATLGKKVYLYHGYMSGGFEGDLPGLLEKAGASKVEFGGGPAWLEIGFKAKAGALSALQAKIDEITSQRLTKDNFNDWTVPWAKRLPSGREVDKVVTTHGADGSTFALPLDARSIAPMTAWLEENGAEAVDIKVLGKDEIEALAQPAAKADGDAEPFEARGLSFFFTGKLASMSEEEAAARVATLGGTKADGVTKALGVLVVGDEGSALYGGGAKSEELRQAEALVAEGAKIRIISESAFLALGG